MTTRILDDNNMQPSRVLRIVYIVQFMRIQLGRQIA